MENKIKAILAVILVFGVAAFITYQLTHNAQFIGVLLITAFVGAIAVGMYNSFYNYFKNKSDNK